MPRKTLLVVAALASVLALAPTIGAAETKAPSARELAAAVQQHGSKMDADRTAVRRALNRPEVREVADRVGIDLDRINATIDTLPPADVATAAQAAVQVNKQLAKSNERGQADADTRRSLPITTILIGALLVVLLVVVVQ